MDPYLVPEDVATALSSLGFLAVAPAGPEGGGWLAVAQDDGARYVELHVLPAVLDDELARRLDLLRAVRHPHLSQLLDASQIAPGRIALLVEHVPGLTVAEIRAARVALTDGEGVTLAVPVLQALAALHDAGLVHGPVTASAVVVRPDGRPVLTDLRGAVLGSGSVDGDVRRWLSTLVALLPVAELDRLVVPPGGRTLRQLLEEALRADVEVDALIGSCFAVAEPEALHLPDAGALAGADLVRSAGRRALPTRAAPRPARGPRTWAIAAAAALVLAVGGWGVSHRTAGAVERPDPVAAAVALSHARGEVIAAGVPEALDDVEVPGGPAHRADVDLLASLRGRSVEGLDIEVRSAAPAGTSGSDVARVELRSAVTSHVVVGADGTRTRVEASPESAVVLELRWTDEGWRVWEVSPS
ncbi:protein kinase family protein [Cellulomonas rhizosphaerae]|uniref:Protein kinase domain-containing protein n=1 Tax=Cellulomonas rhizosphaerae TaxID=2293719 RepID=A0A413RMF8_9CELL|nr:hypothetical protein [Cellulomonas rhizosphaerae]RHA42275.1 hypothetical protein D1825_07620 [Cellulomonas rhizosphaerae]